jgi:exonuclease III
VRAHLLRRVLDLVTWLERRPRAAVAGVLVGTFVSALLVLGARGSSQGSIAIATFNIENFPRSSTQVERALELIESLDVAALGVQEIRDPQAFARAARERLGPSWHFVDAEGPHAQRVGLLYDEHRLSLREAITHRETLIGDRAKPALEVRLSPRDGSRMVRIIVVHLTSGRSNAGLRREQLDALTPIVRNAVDSGERVALVGDFNAVTDEDRRTLAALAHATDLRWASEGLPCTSYWERSAGGCVGTPLDHVFLWRDTDAIEVRGACAEEGCDARENCPEYCDTVSDHCPVRFALP